MWPIVRQDERTQAEVARIMFDNMLTGAAVTYPAMAIVAVIYHGTLSHAWLYGAIGFICAIQTLILLHWRSYKRQVQSREQGGDLKWSVRQLKIASNLSFTIISGISALAVVIAQSTINAAPLMASVMVLIYLVGATVADFIHRPAVLVYPIILLSPMGLLHALSNNPAQWALAAFFVFYFVGVLSYSSMYSKRLQLSIYQRFELDELAHRLEGERARAEAEREKAQVAHDAKTRFFASTSHDVRQPLQAMSMLLDALRAQGADLSQQQRLLQDMDVNMDALRALFDQVLEVSRLDAGTVLLQPRAISLSDLFTRLHSRFTLLAQGKHVTLKLAASQAWVLADPLALERMVANLIGNALKHTPAGGVIWVGWRSQRGRLEVRDSGVGIAKDQQQRIFDEFYQVGAQKDHAQGLGLGLAIVRRLAVLGRQRVGVRSQLGRGSVFWLSLERAAAPQLNMHVAYPPTPQSKPAPDHDEQQEQGHLLYVENDETLLRVTSSLLRMNGWQVTTCANAEQAIAWLKQERHFALLLTDFRMGEGWDGAQLIEAARALPGYARLPAIVMTGDGAVAEQANFGKLNAAPDEKNAVVTDLLHKPVKTSQLLEAIKHCLQAEVQV
jgi:two-component system, sensor histidine kinase